MKFLDILYGINIINCNLIMSLKKLFVLKIEILYFCKRNNVLFKLYLLFDVNLYYIKL